MPKRITFRCDLRLLPTESINKILEDVFHRGHITGEMNMIAVGIDISKGKSTVAAVSETKEAILAPFDIFHSKADLCELVNKIGSLGGNTRIVMEATGHYHNVVADYLHEAGFFVSVVNPVLVHEYGSNSVRRIKTDRKDAIKIARYCIDNWAELRRFAPLEVIRNEIKIFNRLYSFLLKSIHSFENNLIVMLDQTMPGIHRFFSSRKQKNGRQKWVDFASHYWHLNNIIDMGEEEFIEDYRKWCADGNYRFTQDKARKVYEKCQQLTTSLPRSRSTQLLIQSAVSLVIGIAGILAEVKNELISLAKQVPEYEVVISLYGVGEITAAGLIAEIGDVRRFPKRSCLTAFAGVDPLPKQSGKYELKSAPTSKRGSSLLRKTLFQIVSTYLRLSPEDNPLYQFLDKKRAEGKPYFVYMTAASNKFLRLYYAKVRKFMVNLEKSKENEAVSI